MAKRPQNESSIRKLTRLGKKSICVTIPIEIIREFGWREKQRVVVKRIRGGVVIRDYRSKN